MGCSWFRTGLRRKLHAPHVSPGAISCASFKTWELVIFSLHRASPETITRSILFNIPLALMMMTALIIITFWIDIHSRCVALSKSVAAQPNRWAMMLLSKPAMYLHLPYLLLLSVRFDLLHLPANDVRARIRA
jgi:hypothetical protein